MYRRLTPLLATLCSLACAATAGAQTFAQRSVTVNAGIVVIASDQDISGRPANYTPHALFNLDSNSRVKPAGLNLVNPSRATQVTAAINARWGLTVGDLIQKRHAAYWEVFLANVSDNELAEFDFLVMPAYGNVQLNPLEREKLRRFMDKGGVLWVDVASSGSGGPVVQMDLANGLPLPFTKSLNNTGANLFADYTQPLLSYPNPVTYPDLSLMQAESAVGIGRVNLTAAGYGALIPVLQNVEPDSLKLGAVASDALGSFVSVGRVGDGFMVVTSRAVATTLNRIPDGSSYNVNRGAAGVGPFFDRSSDAAAKLVLNMMNLPSGFNQQGGGSHRKSSSPVDIGAPLLNKWSADLALSRGPGGFAPPVVFKGLMVVTTQDRIFVFDANPNQDLDLDGNPDDGIEDYSQGTSRDLLWSSRALPGPISPATCIEVPDAGGSIPLDQILVVDGVGRLWAFDAFNFDGNGRIVGNANTNQAYFVDPPNGAAQMTLGADGPGPYAPTFHEGVVYIADAQNSGLATVGRVWMADPSLGTNVRTGATGWSAGGLGTGLVPEPSGPATVGYIPIQDNSGGLDKVVYIPTRPNPVLGGPNSTAGVTSLWLGVRGERPQPGSFSVSGGVLQVATRASGQGLEVYNPQNADPLGVRITLLKPNGDPYSIQEMNSIFTGGVSQANGILTFTLQPSAVLIDGQFSVRLDYTIDWGTGQPAATSQIMRGQLFLPDDSTRSRRVLQHITLSPTGTMYLVTSSQSSAGSSVNGGAFWAIREEGRGTFRVLTRWDLYNRHNITLNQASTVTYDETLANFDPIVDIVPAGILRGTLQNLTFMSAPIVQDGVVYVLAKGRKPVFTFSIPYTILLAFRADPEVAEIRAGDLGRGFALVQPDLLRSTNRTTPEIFSTLQSNQYVYEQPSDTDRSTVRIENLSATTRGPVLNSISTSLPVIIRRSGQPDLLIEPDRAGGRWSPLLWYTVFSGVDNENGAQASGPPVATGRTLFMGGTSVLPDLIRGVPFAQWRQRGVLFGMDTDIAPNDPYLASDPGTSTRPARPWLKQLYQVRGTSFSDIRPNPSFVWPQTAEGKDEAGVRRPISSDEWVVRLLQTTLRLPNGDLAESMLGVTAGDGGLYAFANEGVWGFTRSDVMVADEGRVARFDPSGNPIWSYTETVRTGTSGDVGGAANVQRLIRPTRAYPVGASETIVVDTGSNRVVRIDAGGRELRSIEGFRLDPIYTPEGYQGGEPTALSRPRDVLTYTQTVAAANNRFSNPQPIEYWVHYLIADAGNGRLVELVDRYQYNSNLRQIGAPVLDSQNNRALSVLYWHSPRSYTGARFEYTSLARVAVGTGASRRWVYAAGIGNILPNRVESGLDTPSGAMDQPRGGTGNGGIVIFDGANTQIINAVDVPPIPGNTFFDYSTGTWNSAAIPARTSSGAEDNRKRLGGLNSISMRSVAGDLTIMFTDSTGVYEIVPSGAGWVVQWMLPRAAYVAMRRDNNDLPLPNTNDPTGAKGNPMDFRPTYARRLESGDVLIVNGYSGTYRKRNMADVNEAWRPFTGEVLELAGEFDSSGTGQTGFNFNKRNLGFNSLSVRFQLPPITGTRGIVLPVYADRR